MFGESPGHLYLNPDDLVASTPSVQSGYTPTPQNQDLAGLGPRRNLNQRRPFKGRNLNLVPQGGLGKVY